MTVRVNKPAINVREELADLRKPTGIAGEAMLRAETPQEQFNLIGAGRRNLVINGGMNVAQRGTSVTGFGGGSDAYTTVDRWKFDLNSTMAGRMTIEQVDDSPNGISGKSLKISCTTADTSIGSAERVQIQQRFEGQNLQSIGKGTPDAKPITVSFYVKANASFTYGLELYDGDNGRQITKLFTTTTEWNRIELTFPADTTGAFDNDNNNSLYLLFAIHAGTNYTGGTLNSDAWAPAVSANRAAGIDSFYSSTDNELFITGVQLELGKVATPFEHRSYGEELNLAQRYFQRFPSSDQADGGAYAGIGGFGNCISTTDFSTSISLPVTMRVEPTMSPSASGTFRVYHENTNTVVTTAPVIIDPYSSVSQVHIRSVVGSAALTVGNGGQLQQSNDNDAHISLDSEL